MFKSLLIWYNEKARDLPWRNTIDPYKIWLSEIMLQQTRVDQGLSYYEKFVSRFPKVDDLAAADIDEVLLMWQGLGYYSRARNLHQAAKTIVNKYNGIFPNKLDEIKSLKGIGDYTAAAIGSIAFNIPVAVVDGNVFRVLSRYFEVKTPIDTTKGKKEFDILAAKVLNIENPAHHNQAIMELGATVCTPKVPKCNTCPLMSGCGGYSSGRFIEFPVKKGKIKQRKRYFSYLVIYYGEKVLLQKRSGKDIWEGLFQFPLIETDNGLQNIDLLKKIEEQPIFAGTEYIVKSISSQAKHILSHQIIYAKFITIQVKEKLAVNSNSFIEVDYNRLDEYALPRLITKYLDEVNML